MEEGARLFTAVRHLFPAEEGSAPAFNLLVRGISRLSEAPDPARAAGVVLATRLKLLALLGYAPEMACCAACGCEGPFCGFSPNLGGVVCESCASTGATSCFALSSGAVGTLQTLLSNPLAEVDGFEFDERAMAEGEQVVAIVERLLADLERVPERARRYDTVVFCLANYNSLAVLDQMRDLGPKLVVVSALSPVYLAEVPWVSTAVAVYGSGRDSFRAGFAVLAGEIAAAGTMPVSFGGTAP